jgi:hypothetical protein
MLLSVGSVFISLLLRLLLLPFFFFPFSSYSFWPVSFFRRRMIIIIIIRKRRRRRRWRNVRFSLLSSRHFRAVDTRRRSWCCYFSGVDVQCPKGMRRDEASAAHWFYSFHYYTFILLLHTHSHTHTLTYTQSRVSPSLFAAAAGVKLAIQISPRAHQRRRSWRRRVP